MKKRQPPKDPVELGAVTAAHGLRGLLRVKPFTETVDGLAAYGPVWVTARDGSPAGWCEVTVTGVNKGVALVALEGIGGRDEADALKGATFSVDRSALPAAEDGEFYQSDLVGLVVERSDGAPVGTVRAVQNFGAGDLLDIQPSAGESVLVPFTQALVPVVDIESGTVVVDADFIASMLAPAKPDKGDEEPE